MLASKGCPDPEERISRGTSFLGFVSQINGAMGSGILSDKGLALLDWLRQDSKSLSIYNLYMKHNLKVLSDYVTLTLLEH